MQRIMANLGPHRMRAPVAFLNEIAARFGPVTDVPEVLGIADADMSA